MGRKRRLIPLRLGEKLKAVREHLNLSQSEMLALIKPDEDKNNRAVISEYERGVKAPGCIGLLSYARLAKVSTDVLIDDSLELSFDEKGNASTAAVNHPTEDDRSTEFEHLVVDLKSGLLDIIDNVYLQLLYTTPRRLRPRLTRDYFYRALIVAAIHGYNDCPEENRLIVAWRCLIKRVAARTENNAEKNIAT